jgi:hypothetical protein
LESVIAPMVRVIPRRLMSMLTIANGSGALVVVLWAVPERTTGVFARACTVAVWTVAW